MNQRLGGYYYKNSTLNHQKRVDYELTMNNYQNLWVNVVNCSVNIGKVYCNKDVTLI